MQRATTIADLRRAVASARKSGKTISLVPTMGALHDGHLSLIDLAAADGSFVVVSVFVNPTQFGEGEDLDRYPRDLESDCARCESRGTGLLFCPPTEEVYAADARTWVTVQGLSAGLCGLFRPVHFRGVATVVVKLLNMVQPDVAVFGRKDFQQLRVIETCVRDLDMPVRIVGGRTVREPDGLALSSRNQYLSDAQRRRASAIPRVLTEVCRRFERGERTSLALIGDLRETLLAAANSIDYFGLYDPVDLSEVEPDAVLPPDPVLALAVHVGATRLIDNVQLGVDPAPADP
jgi:pantoate--beta-alanine ligase